MGPATQRRCVRGLAGLLAVALLSSALALAAPVAQARETVSSYDPDYAAAPSFAYAALDSRACFAKLDERKVVYEKVNEAPGVMAPVRLPKGVGGVTYRTLLPREQARSSPWEVFDCRLVLSLVDLSKILQAHGIDEVIMFSAWRPPGKSWPKDKLAVRHPGGLAIDIMRLGRDAPKTEPAADGGGGDAPAAPARQAAAPERQWLDVEEHFHGRIGDTTCGESADPPTKSSPETVELRAIVCEVAAARIFTSILTPNYDKPHVNHLHFDLAVDVKWRMVR